MKHEPIFASEARAAQLLDMTPREFAKLVEGGHLPRPCTIGDVKRFDVEELRRVIRGDLIGGAGMTW